MKNIANVVISGERKAVRTSFFRIFSFDFLIVYNLVYILHFQVVPIDF